MGDWTLIVSGTGIHHNNDPRYDGEIGAEADADQRLLEFVDQLTRDGHQVRHAAIIHGGGADTVETAYTSEGQRVAAFNRANGKREDAQALIAARKERREAKT